MYGAAQSVALPSGAATAGINYPLPGGERTKIEALCFELVTAAGVANRQVIARLQDATGEDVYAVPAPAVQTANSTVIYSFAPLIPSFGTLALGFMGGPFPAIPSVDNLTLVVTVVAAAVGDTISRARLTVCQWQREPSE